MMDEARMPSTVVGPDATIACLRCSQPAGSHGEHHREHKGMGGRGWKAPEIAHDTDPLCRGCHSARHDEKFDYIKQGDWYVGTKGGDFRSPVTYDNDSPDKRRWELDKLTAEWHEADLAAVFCYKVQCQAAYALKDRIAWMPEWWLQAAKQLSKDEKAPVDWRRVYDRVSSWETFELLLGGDEAWDNVVLLGEKARQAVCSHEDPQWALDTAVVERLAGGTVADVVRLLKGGDVSDERKTSETCTCNNCGHEHSKKGV